jgi:hypothetical protein
MTRETLRDSHPERLRIPPVGLTCSPELGSEPGVLWNWAWHLSARHDVWVVSRPIYRPAVELVTRRHRERAPRFVWVDLPVWFNPRGDPARGQSGIQPQDSTQQAAIKVPVTSPSAVISGPGQRHPRLGRIAGSLAAVRRGRALPCRHRKLQPWRRLNGSTPTQLLESTVGSVDADKHNCNVISLKELST